MKTLSLMAGLMLLCASAFAESTETQLRIVLQRNFDACTHEDIDALMDTQARTLPKQDMLIFRQAAEKMFEETDVYLRLEECELLQVKGVFAAARVVQVTLPGDESARDNPDEQERFYRNHTMLLPAYARVEYIQTFKREGGKWRLWEIVTEPKPIGDGDDAEPSQNLQPCPNGNCNVQSRSVFQ